MKYCICSRVKEISTGRIGFVVDVSISEKDFDHRIYAEPISIINHGTFGYAIMADKTEDNYER